MSSYCKAVQHSQFVSDTKIAKLIRCPPISKMDDEVIQKRWEFRRMDNDDDSSSDESKSSSEAAHKRRKLVSGLVSLENEDGLGDCRVQQTGKCNPHTDDQSMVQKGNRRHLRRSGKGKLTCNGIERGSSKVGKKKSTTSVYDPAALDELKVFTDTLLEDLKATRENLLSWMRKEMQKLVDDEVALRLKLREKSSGRENVRVQPGDDFEKDVLLQHENNPEENVFAQDHNTLKEVVQVKHLDNFEEIKSQVDYWNSFDSSTKAQKCDIGSPQRSTKSNTSAGYNNSYHVKDSFQSCFADKNILVQNQTNFLSGSKAQTYSCRSSESSLIGENTAPFTENQVDCAQGTGSRTSSRKEIRGRLGLPTELNSCSNLSSQKTASIYSTFPSVSTETCFNLSNYPRTPFDGNTLEVNSAKANPMFKVNNGQQVRLSGDEQEERSGNLPQIGSRNLNVDRQSISSSSIGTLLQDPLHQGRKISFSIPNQVPFEYLPREEKNEMGLRMVDGAIRFSGGSYAISEDYLANNFYSHFN